MLETEHDMLACLRRGAAAQVPRHEVLSRGSPAATGSSAGCTGRGPKAPDPYRIRWLMRPMGQIADGSHMTWTTADDGRTPPDVALAPLALGCRLLRGRREYSDAPRTRRPDWTPSNSGVQGRSPAVAGGGT